MNEQTKLSLANDENEYQAFLIATGNTIKQVNQTALVIKNLGETNQQKTEEKGLFMIEIF